MARTVGRLGEWGLLDRLLPALSRRLPPWVEVGPGDDAAVVSAGPAGRRWVCTTDMLVEGVHFEKRWTSGEDLGHKALAVNLSDLAAMGGVTPAFGVVSLGITSETPVDYVDSIHRGMQRLAKLHRFYILGGDTVRAPRIVISVTALGWTDDKKRLVLRGGARPGDVLLVTGTLGDAAAGLSILTGGGRGVPAGARDVLVRRLRRPQPRLDLARRLTARPGLTGLLDSSDGLWRSVKILCRASRTGARIEAEKLPLSPALRRWALAAGRDPLDAALTGGEDYELVMAARPAAARILAARGWARAVGRIVPASEGLKVYEQGRRRQVPHGFEHFS